VKARLDPALAAPPAMQTIATAPPSTTPEPVASPQRRWRPSAPPRGSVLATVLVWLPMLGWYAAFRPGLMSFDSVVIYEMAKHGNWLDLQPPAYIAAMWVSTTLLGSPSLLTLGQSLFLAAGIVAVARALLRLGVNRYAVYGTTAVIALLPTVGAFSVALWKDIPYAATFLFIGARVIDLTRARWDDDLSAARDAAWSICAWLCASVALRQNGVLLGVGLVVVLWLCLRSQRRQLVAVLLIPLALLGALKLVVYPLIGITSSGSQPAVATQLHDIADAASRDPGMFDASDRAFMETIGRPFELWGSVYSSFGCSEATWEWDPRFHWEQVNGHASRVVSLWLKVVREHPAMVVRNRLCVGSVAYRPDNDHKLYTVGRGVDANPDGLRTVPISGALHDRAVSLLDRLDENDVQSWVWRAPGWMYLADVVFIAVAVKRRRWILLLPVLPLLMLQFSVLPVNPAQDARYMFPGLILAVLLLPAITLAWRREGMEAPAAEP
jgi:Family of unknown function (DUF6020)